MALFGKGNKEEMPAQDTLPVDQIGKLRQEGLSNNQIVQSLQRSGYQTDQIFDAMNQADMRSAAPIPDAVPSAEAEMPPLPDAASAYPERPAQPSAGAPQEPQQEYAPPNEDERIEEIAEAIIEEKWSELIQNVNKIVEWKKTMDTKITKLEHTIESLQKNFESLHKAMFERMDSYNTNVLKVGSNLKAMDEVFKKVLPSFTDNVSELSRITGSLKAKKRK